MAEVVLEHIEKIYPNTEPVKKKKAVKRRSRGAQVDKPDKDSDGPDAWQSRPQLKITDEGVVAVEDFNLKIADREFVVLVGPSGCGKSTTLRMVAGLESITRGTLTIDGQVMNDVAPKDRDIAMVFQNYALYPHMTVRDNLAFPLKLRKVPGDEITQKVDEAAKILGITQFLDRRPKALSGGQRQRVAIGRAIVREPKVLLMDEPLSNLDAKLRNQMRAEIIKLRKRINTTFMYVTHDQTEAMTLGDRIVIMKDGIVQQIGTPQDVYEHPHNIFVSGFIGVPQMNYFDAQLVKDGGRYSVVVDHVTFNLDDEKEQRLNERNVAPQDIILGCRPEHVSLDKVEGQMLQGVIDVSEMMGSEVHLHLDVDGKDVIVIVPSADVTRKHGAGSLDVGQKLQFTFAGDVVHLFSKETEENLVY